MKPTASVSHLPLPVRLHAKLIDLWFAAQVELHGRYSVARLESFYEYERRTPMWRVILVTTLTPMLVAVMINSTDAIPLELPSRGLDHSTLFWLRAYITIFCVAGPTMLQLRIIIPQLNLTLISSFGLTVVSSAMAVAAQFGLANLIGYPVPFGLVLGTPACFWTLVIGIVWPRRKQLKTDANLRQLLVDYVLVWVCQIGFTVIYPVYNYIFSQLTGHAQTAFTLVLPILKLLNRNWISHSLREADDVKPELVVFNIEVFHAMYTSVCMQSSSSSNSTFAVMAIDLIQAWLSVRDVNDVLEQVDDLLVKVPPKGRRVSVATADASVPNAGHGASVKTAGRARRNLLEVSMDILAEDPDLRLHPSLQQTRTPVETSRRTSSLVQMPTQPAVVTVKKKTKAAAHKYRIMSFISSPKRAIVAAGRERIEDPVGLTRPERLLVVQRTLQLAFLTEFVVLVEYVEVIMPAIYNACVRGMIQLPNREFYSLLAGKTEPQLNKTVDNVAIYGSLEFLSYVLFCIALRWRVRYSVLKQIAFVLERQFVMVQSKLVMWVFYIIQSSLYHFGADFSFSFSWLYANN